MGDGQVACGTRSEHEEQEESVTLAFAYSMFSDDMMTLSCHWIRRIRTRE